MSKKGGFGAAKPLPGQTGYKVSASQQLEREALEMENRLKLLQERMTSEGESKPKKSGDSHWKTARADRGGITTYAKDVQEKTKKRAAAPKADPSLKATASARRTNRQANATGGFGDKDVDHWSVGDVGQWLDSVLLSQYKDIFVQNQISGPILLDISLEDLDYMSVTALGHRKIILKGIEDLRQNRRVTKQLFAPSVESSVPSRNTRSSEGRTAAAEAQSLRADAAAANDCPQPKVHWSALEPISSHKVSSGEDYSMVNGADADMLDEEAEQRAFQEAVMAWRRGDDTAEKGGRTLSLTGYGKAAGDNKCSADDGMWSNPFGNVEDSEVGLGLGADSEVLVSARGHIADAEQHWRLGQGRNLADGNLDEAKEQAEFRAAVEAWRTGKPAELAGKSVAQKLAEDMDRQLQFSSKKLQEDQINVRKRIDEASRALADAKKRLEDEEKQGCSGMDMDDDLMMEDYHSPSRNQQTSNGFCGWHDGVMEDDNGRLSPSSSLNDSDDNGGAHEQSHVEVELIQSTLNTGSVCAAADAEYVVAEPSSDEDDDMDITRQQRDNEGMVQSSVEVHEISS